MELEIGGTILHSGELALEEAIDLSKDRLQNECQHVKIRILRVISMQT